MKLYEVRSIYNGIELSCTFMKHPNGMTRKGVRRPTVRPEESARR